jgi:DNA-binding MarR family transcriptional regulator
MALTPELDSPLYVEMIRLIERAHRRFLEVVKDELDRIGRDDINNVQAVLLYNIGQEELTPSELKGRGYYLGSNVSYNLKKLLELGFIEQKKSRADRRTILISLTPAGAEIADMVSALFERQLKSLKPIGGVDDDDLRACNRVLMRIDRFWQDQVLYRL